MAVDLTIKSTPITVTIQDQAPITVTITYTNPINIPAGGTIGQILAKKSDADYDVEWITLRL